MNVGNQQHSQGIQFRRPILRRERSLSQDKAFFEQPTVRIPHGGEMRIQEARYHHVRVALQQLENSFVGIDPSPFFAGHYAGRRKLSCVEGSRCGSPCYGGRNYLMDLGSAGL